MLAARLDEAERGQQHHRGRQRHDDLVETLRAWLDAFGDVVAASAAMYVHPNTFRYRLRRLTEVSGIDLTDPEARFAARAADTGSGVTIGVQALEGSWASLHAAPLRPATAAGSVAVTIGPPAPAQVADVLIRAWDLSPRERQIAAAVFSGQGTRQAARALNISEHTARQHVKAVFAKVGVHSRDHLRDVLTGGLG